MCTDDSVCLCTHTDVQTRRYTRDIPKGHLYTHVHVSVPVQTRPSHVKQGARARPHVHTGAKAHRLGTLMQ